MLLKYLMNFVLLISLEPIPRGPQTTFGPPRYPYLLFGKTQRKLNKINIKSPF